MTWHTKAFSGLSTLELYTLLQLRSKVFVVEQNCPYQDLDNKDLESIHLWAEQDNTVIACCRLLPGNIAYAEPSIGRVATDPSFRKHGTGRIMMEKAIGYIQDNWRSPAIRISAQLYLKVFYESLGFLQTGDPYLEDDIPHIEMLRKA